MKTYEKGLLVTGGIIVATIVDLLWMGWSRTQPQIGFSKAGWNASQFGKGKYTLVPSPGKIFGKHG